MAKTPHVSTKKTVKKVVSKKSITKKNVFTTTKKTSHAFSNARAEKLGSSIGKIFGVKKGIVIKAVPSKLANGQKPRLFQRYFSKRKVDPKKPVNSSFNSYFRNEMPAYDELLSTSTTREFFNGFFKQKGYNSLSADLQKRLDTVADLMSKVRIPTKFSGYSKSTTEIMQHPTSGGTGFFGTYKGNSASNHSKLDMQRKNLAIEAGEAEIQKIGATLESVASAMLKTAIEFTLNHFTAPVTAKNVFKYSTKSTLKISDTSLTEQLQAREAIKGIYETELGGALRVKPVKETAQQARERPWQLSIKTPTPLTHTDLSPPSPRRL